MVLQVENVKWMKEHKLLGAVSALCCTQVLHFVLLIVHWEIWLLQKKNISFIKDKTKATDRNTEASK